MAENPSEITNQLGVAAPVDPTPDPATQPSPENQPNTTAQPHSESGEGLGSEDLHLLLRVEMRSADGRGFALQQQQLVCCALNTEFAALVSGTISDSLALLEKQVHIKMRSTFPLPTAVATSQRVDLEDLAM